MIQCKIINVPRINPVIKGMMIGERLVQPHSFCAVLFSDPTVTMSQGSIINEWLLP
jgi:hypothetical protein